MCQKKGRNAKKYAAQFLELLEDDYGVTINKTVAESQNEIKRTKRIELPIMADTQLLKKYVEKKEKYCWIA